MLRSQVKTYKHKIGNKTYLVIQIFQTASASAVQGNVLASNAINVKIMKNSPRKRR